MGKRAVRRCMRVSKASRSRRKGLMDLASTVLYNEVVTAMALVGARTVDELKPEMVRPKGWLPMTLPAQ
jgi:isopentenyl diphosphate isomerase/L-lactate dehydrogenase-like FMN-dependent dehydrogenase